ncbi:MAG TPA: transposase [Candidatus Saccharimonadia bacterium]|nr:transposase [Candidatus Saccharimonadia bacterium]
MTAVGGIGASGIGQRGKIVLKRGRWENTHKGPPLGTKGFWLQITRPPYRKTRSSFKCACPEVPDHRRDQLERLIRYTARGAVALERLEEDANGDLVYTFTKPWADGTTGMTLSPLEL